MGTSYTKSTITSGFASTTNINNERANVEEALERSLSRHGDTPNQMEAEIDMNSNRIINVGAPVNDNDAVRRQDVTIGGDPATASVITIDDPSGYYDSTSVETALQEIWDDLGDTANGEGASRVSIEDADGHFTATTVEAALDEIKTEGTPWVFKQSAAYSDADTLTTDTTTTDDRGDFVFEVGRRVLVYLGTSDTYVKGVIQTLGTRGTSGTVDIASGSSLANEDLTIWVHRDRPDDTGNAFYDVWFGAAVDGTTDDQSALQAAVSFVQTDASYVLLLTGFSAVGSTILLNSGSHISSVLGSDTAGVNLLDSVDDDVFRIDSSTSSQSDISVTRITIDGNRGNQTAASHLIGHTGGNGVESYTVAKCVLKNSYSSGIELLSNSSPPAIKKVRIEENRLESCGAQSISLRNGQDVVIDSNLFFDWGLQDAENPAISIQNETERLTIRNNLFVSTTGSKFAIEAQGSSAIINGFIFTGNLLVSTDGVAETGLSGRFNHSTIVGNVWDNGAGSNRHGMEIVGHDNVISENAIDNGQIVVKSTDAVADTVLTDVSIVGNSITNSGSSQAGIAIGRGGSGSASTTATRIVIANNTVNCSGSTGSDGINVGTFGETVIVNECMVHGNTLIGDNSGGSGVSVEPLSGSEGLVISSNRITQFNNGVQIPDDDCDEIYVVNNDLRGNVSNNINDNTTTAIVDKRGNRGYTTESYGNASVSPDANGEDTIAHGCAETPSYANANLRGDNANGVDIVSVGGSLLTVRIKDASGADVTSGTFTVDWEARV